jgi:probable HAF family extracellular repeat protein
MKLHVVAVAWAAALLAGCASGGAGSAPQQNAILPAGHAQSQQYTVAALDPLAGSSAGASSINNLNWVSGVSSLASSSYQHAALWENGGSAMDLGTLGGPNSGVEWPVKNDHGLISGISETSAAQKLGETWSCAAAFFPQPPSGHICRGFAWRNGRMTGLRTLGGNNGFAAGANDRGEIVGWAEKRKRDSTCTPPQVLQFEAVLYGPSGSVKALPPLSGDKDGAATEINDKGEVVGISGICDQAVGRFTAEHAVMWRKGKIINLGSLGGEAWNTPMAINENGDQVVGFSDLPGDESGTPNFHAFLWTKRSGMTDLGTLPGDSYSEALGINDSGVIVGASYGASFSTSRAFIWQNGTMTDLNSLLGASPSLYLLYANDINDQGVIAGGACVLVSGSCGDEFPAFMATPTSVKASRSSNGPARPPVLSPQARRLIRTRALMP